MQLLSLIAGASSLLLIVLPSPCSPITIFAMGMCSGRWRDLSKSQTCPSSPIACTHRKGPVSRFTSHASFLPPPLSLYPTPHCVPPSTALPSTTRRTTLLPIPADIPLPRVPASPPLTHAIENIIKRTHYVTSISQWVVCASPCHTHTHIHIRIHAYTVLSPALFPPPPSFPLPLILQGSAQVLVLSFFVSPLRFWVLFSLHCEPFSFAPILCFFFCDLLGFDSALVTRLAQGVFLILCF